MTLRIIYPRILGEKVHLALEAEILMAVLAAVGGRQNPVIIGVCWRRILTNWQSLSLIWVTD